MPLPTDVAGPDGSGKSTLIAQMARERIEWGEYLNADDIARELVGPPSEISLRAQQIVRDRREHALRHGWLGILLGIKPLDSPVDGYLE